MGKVQQHDVHDHGCCGCASSPRTTLWQNSSGSCPLVSTFIHLHTPTGVQGPLGPLLTLEGDIP